MSSWSIRSKMLLAIILALSVSLSIIIGMAASLFRSTIAERVEKYELRSTVESIRNEIDKDVSVPLAHARSLANNSFLLDRMDAGEPENGTDNWKHYAKKIKKHLEETRFSGFPKARAITTTKIKVSCARSKRNRPMMPGSKCV